MQRPAGIAGGYMTKIVIAMGLAALVWIPYYVYGVPLAKNFASSSKFLLSATAIGLPTLLGFFGIFFLQNQLLSNQMSVGGFRVMLICSTQLIAVATIAMDTRFNTLAIIGGLLVVVGAVLGACSLSAMDQA